MASVSYIECFNTMPDDIKDLIYSKIIYPQSKELLQEIRDHRIYTIVPKKLGYEAQAYQLSGTKYKDTKYNV